jgi:hypothetical protein
MVFVHLSSFVTTILLQVLLVVSDDETHHHDTNIQKQLSCWNEFPFMSQQCWMQGIAKGLGVVIIVGACLSKAPVLINMIRSRSSTGISRGATYGDVLSKFHPYTILFFIISQ